MNLITFHSRDMFDMYISKINYNDIMYIINFIHDPDRLEYYLCGIIDLLYSTFTRSNNLLMLDEYNYRKLFGDFNCIGSVRILNNGKYTIKRCCTGDNTHSYCNGHGLINGYGYCHGHNKCNGICINSNNIHNNRNDNIVTEEINYLESVIYCIKNTSQTIRLSGGYNDNIIPYDIEDDINQVISFINHKLHEYDDSDLNKTSSYNIRYIRYLLTDYLSICKYFYPELYT